MNWILGSRKFIVISILLLISSIFRIFDVLTSKDYADLLSSVGVAFMGANTVEHMFAAAKDWIAAKQGGSDGGEDTK